MVVALFVVALAMIGTGLAAVVQGYPIIVVERGWTLVLSGTILASAGALLFGLGLVLRALGRLETALARPERARPPVAFPPAPPHVLGEPAAGSKPSPVPGATDAFATAAALGGATALGATTSASTPPEEFAGEPEGAPPADAPSPPIKDLEITPDPIIEGPVIASSLRPSLTESGEEPSDETALSDAKPAPSDDAEAVDPPAMAEPDTAASDAPAEPASPPMIVGRYASGGNSYSMFSDGSIEAETPNGRFRFNSLEELKEFIASGGESAS